MQPHTSISGSGLILTSYSKEIAPDMSGFRIIIDEFKVRRLGYAM
jgi:hypothetical protein